MFFSIFSYVLYLLGEVKCSSMIYHYAMWKLSVEIKSSHYQGEYPNLLCLHFHFVCVCVCGGMDDFRGVSTSFVRVWNFVNKVTLNVDDL